MKNNLIDKDSPIGTQNFDWQIRVYYEDTDAAGVVYHSSYLNYMERARTEWLRSAGYSQNTLINRENVAFVVVNINLDFIAPATLDELLDIHSNIISCAGSKMIFDQYVVNQKGELKCQGNIQTVCINPNNFKPKRIPEKIKAKLNYDN